MNSKVTDSNMRKLCQHVAVYKNLVYKYEAFNIFFKNIEVLFKKIEFEFFLFA